MSLRHPRRSLCAVVLLCSFTPGTAALARLSHPARAAHDGQARLELHHAVGLVRHKAPVQPLVLARQRLQQERVNQLKQRLAQAREQRVVFLLLKARSQAQLDDLEDRINLEREPGPRARLQLERQAYQRLLNQQLQAERAAARQAAQLAAELAEAEAKLAELNKPFAAHSEK